MNKNGTLSSTSQQWSNEDLDETSGAELTSIYETYHRLDFLKCANIFRRRCSELRGWVLEADFGKEWEGTPKIVLELGILSRRLSLPSVPVLLLHEKNEQGVELDIVKVMLPYGGPIFTRPRAAYVAKEGRIIGRRVGLSKSDRREIAARLQKWKEASRSIPPSRLRPLKHFTSSDVAHWALLHLHEMILMWHVPLEPASDANESGLAKPAPALRGKVLEVATYIRKHPGKLGAVISEDCHISFPYFRAMFRQKLKQLGFHNSRDGEGYFPPPQQSESNQAAM